ncbi:ATP-binding cassette domain-containing protein [Massilia sp. H-1]|nr:ATP-binding cassette domain-containing protein [Massilia sp. H-1]
MQGLRGRAGERRRQLLDCQRLDPWRDRRERRLSKSTLMSILYGYYNANSGSVLIDGQVQHIRTSHEAIALGIGMVHQHFMLVENFTVLDNVMLGTEGGFKLAAHRAVAEAKLREICARYRLDVDPLAKIEDLSVGAQQRRNSQADLPQRQHPDPRRADRRADGAGNRVAVRDPAPVQGTGQDHHPDHPQAGRNHGDHRPGDRDAQPAAWWAPSKRPPPPRKNWPT